MIWLASFPRSGNTFFRNVLFEVYGIESSTYHKETAYPVDKNYDQYQVVKTHLLPDQIEPNDPSIKSVYLVRDGRDALVSIAHHRKDLIAPQSDFQVNLLEAMIAEGGSHFGGWSENVRQWSERADIVIHFSDLISDPIREIEKLRSIMDLPSPKLDKLPTFKDLKFGTPKYGSTKKNLKHKNVGDANGSKFFRKGKVGGYRDEMSPEIEQLFWEIHGDVMRQMNLGSEHNSNQDSSPAEPYKILIEANKLFMPGNDGIKRYLVELLNNLTIFQNLYSDKWKIDLHLEGGRVISLKSEEGEQKDFDGLIKDDQKRLNEIEKIAQEHKPYEIRLLQIKGGIQKVLPQSVYQGLSKFYKALPIRNMLNRYRRAQVGGVMENNAEEFAQYDLIHIPLPQNFYFLEKLKGEFLVTVHDLTHRSFPEFHTKENVLLSEEGMQSIISKNAHLLAISESTKRDILSDYPEINEDSISVIYEACNRSHFSPTLDANLLQTVQQKYGLPQGPYFLTLSTLEPRKNLVNTIKAFEKLLEESENKNLSLFICGKKGWKINDLLKEEKIKSDNIFFTGFVDEGDLPVLYSNALALCYVSLYEGFGLPPLEAMACGTAVIYGDNSSMPEVIGEAGLAANPFDIDDMKSKMIRILDKDLRDDLSEQSIIRAHQFSWLKTAWQTLNLYEECIEKNNSQR